jgi:hypothetical protein
MTAQLLHPLRIRSVTEFHIVSDYIVEVKNLLKSGLSVYWILDIDPLDTVLRSSRRKSCQSRGFLH